jgi:hypothetical protein
VTPEPDRSARWRGSVHVFFAYDVGAAIDLSRARELASMPSAAARLQHRHRAPPYFQFTDPPLRLAPALCELPPARACGAAACEFSLYDFGGVTLRYAMEFDGDLEDLIALACELSDSQTLREDAQHRTRDLVTRLAPVVDRPGLSEASEDYLVFHLEPTAGSPGGAELLRAEPQRLARILRAEPGPLADAQVADALQLSLSYGPRDLVLVDWNGALVIDTEPGDILAVLELANQQLLEMRDLDGELDRALDRVYALVSRPPSLWTSLMPSALRVPLRQVSRLQVDGALLFERVHNSLKLVGDPYLARVGRLAGQRFSLPEWNAAVLRKLDALDSVYGKLNDHAATVRMELLEWVIVVLILVSIVIPFVAGGGGH